jgi:hypothetical protein
MKGQLNKAAKLTAVLLAAATFGFAQTSTSAPAQNNGSDSYHIGYGQPSQTQHKQGVPGTINYVEGQAELNNQPLGPDSAGYTVAQPNESIETQAGYVEVLLTPGAFLRIGHNSDVVLQNAGLANVQLRVVHGEAMIEAANLIKGTTMQVNMDGATAQIEKRGLYDFNANDQTVRVLDGKAKVVDASVVKTVGKDDQLVLASAKLKTASFDKKAEQSDPLYVWSQARSEAEAQSNVRVASNVAAYGGWYGPGWYWDPFWADYAFVPGAGFLYSPFGWGFYSPGFVYAAPLYGGIYGRGFYHGWHGGVATGVHSAPAFRSGFAGGFHGGGRR